MLKRNAYRSLLTLAFLLDGCQSTRLTPTTAMGTEPLVCTQWLPITYAGKHDTPETVMQVKRSNAARDAYCAH